MKNKISSNANKINTEVLINALSSFSRRQVLVIGDIMVDEYIWGSVKRISPEAPVQVVEVIRQEVRLGGCGNTVDNLCSLGSSVSVASVIGDGFHRQFMFDEFKRLGVDTRCLLVDNTRRATKKTRVIAANQQVVRIDFETTDPISRKWEKEIAGFLDGNAKLFDVILVSDYAKGVVTSKVVSSAIENAKKRSIPVVVDPKGKDFSKYSGATIITPNTAEAEAASNVKIDGNLTAEKAAQRILMKTKCDAVLITRGKFGMTLFEASKRKAIHIPAQAREVFDVSGAGDTVLSVLGLAIASGLSLEEGSLLANTAGGIVVGKLGTAAVEKEEFLTALTRGIGSRENSKEKTLKELGTLASSLKAQGMQIVFTNGSFDPVCAGHVELLQKAKSWGDILIVGISSDNALRHFKGSTWPVICQTERVKMLSALEYVDYVVIYEDGDYLGLIESVRPDVLVKAKNVSSSELIGRNVVEQNGGRFVLLELKNAIQGFG